MARRFYEKVSIEEVAEGHIIRLDTHKLMTPAKKLLLLPYAQLAEAVADEWRQVDEDIILSDMPMSRLVYTAIDSVSESYESTAQASIEVLTQIAQGGDGLVPDPLRLTGLAHGAGLLGAAVLALRMESGEDKAENIWRAAFLDDFFQFEQWGEDSEAMARLKGMKREIETLSDYFSLFFS